MLQYAPCYKRYMHFVENIFHQWQILGIYLTLKTINSLILFLYRYENKTDPLPQLLVLFFTNRTCLFVHGHVFGWWHGVHLQTLDL